MADTAVLVIGAGATGAAVSWRLASQGIAVTCLDRGYWQPQESTPVSDRYWESARLTERSPNPNVRRLPDWKEGH